MDHEEIKERSTKDKTAFKPALILALCSIGVVSVLIAASIWNSKGARYYEKDSHEISKEEATELVRKGLTKKYGDEDEFDISPASREKNNNNKEYYKVDVHSKNLDITFSETVSTDGAYVHDKYELCKYKPQVDKELDPITESTEWYEEKFWVYCDNTDLDDNRRTFQEYKADKVTLSVELNITPVADDPNLGESLYQYLTELHDMGYNQIDFSIRDDFAGEILLFDWNSSRPYMSDIADKEGFIKRVNRWLESGCQCGCESCSRNQETSH